MQPCFKSYVNIYLLGCAFFFHGDTKIEQRFNFHDLERLWLRDCPTLNPARWALLPFPHRKGDFVVSLADSAKHFFLNLYSVEAEERCSLFFTYH